MQYNIPVTSNNDIEVIIMEINKFEYDMLREMYEFFDIVGTLPVIRVNPAVMQNKDLALDAKQKSLYESLEKLEAFNVLMYTDRANSVLELWDHHMVEILRTEYEDKLND